MKLKAALRDALLKLKESWPEVFWVFILLASLVLWVHFVVTVYKRLEL